MKVRSLVWSATLLLTLVAYLPAVAQDSSDAATQSQAQKTRTDGPEAAATPTPTPIQETGEVVIRTYTRTDVGPAVRVEGQYQVVPGMTTLITVPQARGSDLIIVTFSGECRLSGTTGNNDRLQVQIRADNVPLEPTGPTTTDGVAFCSDDRSSSNSIQAAMRLDPGPHRIQVFWKLVDMDTNDVLVGQLAHYALVILQSE
jgi:hypothetical protein